MFTIDFISPVGPCDLNALTASLVIYGGGLLYSILVAVVPKLAINTELFISLEAILSSYWVVYIHSGGS